MTLDNTTVFIMSALVALVISLFYWVLVLSPGASVWRRDWALGNTGLSLGTALLLTQGQWNPWISIVLANFFIIGGYFLLESGLRAFSGKPSPRWYPWGYFGVFAVGYLSFAIFQDSMPGRSTVHSLLALTVMVRMIGLLATAVPDIHHRYKALVRGFMAVLGALVLFYLIRLIMAFVEFNPAGTTVLTPSGSLAILVLFILVAMVAWTLGFISLDLLRAQGLQATAIASRDRLFALVAHDLRGPLGSSSRLLEHLLEEPGLPLAVQEGLAACAKSTSANYELLERLLDWAKAQSGGLVLSPRRIGVAALLEGVLRPLQTTAESKGLKWATQVEPDLVCWGDESALMAVVRNLVSNAIKFTPRGGSVGVVARAKGAGVELRICDEGTGLPAAVWERIETGLLPDSSLGTGGEKGTGLGLSLCRELVRHHNGTLKFSSGAGGTEAVVYLPPGPELTSGKTSGTPPTFH